MVKMLQNIWQMFLVCTALVLSLPLFAAEPSVESMHIQIARTVFRLEHQEVISRPGQEKPETVLKPDGTAFVVQHNDHDYLVTAGHVAKLGYDLRARVPAKRMDNQATEVIELYVPKESWVFHKSGPEIKEWRKGKARFYGVDVAVTPLLGIKDRTIVSFRSCSPCSQGVKSQLAPDDPLPPLSVLITGFPSELGLNLTEQRPLFRSGIVALVASESLLPVDGAFVDERSFVIDIRVQPGNSGSPVFNSDLFSGEIHLVGLVSATSDGGEFTIAEPASRIREAIEHAIEKPPVKQPKWDFLRSEDGM